LRCKKQIVFIYCAAKVGRVWRLCKFFLQKTGLKMRKS